MEQPWPVGTTLAAARAALLRHGAVTEGFRGLDITTDGAELALLFQWRRDPHRYVVGLPLPDVPPISPWTGVPVDSAEQWAQDLAGLLMEELDTGLVRRTTRVVHGDVVRLVFPGGPDVTPAGYHVSGVPLDSDAGWWLAKAGLDVARPRRMLAEHRLVSWLQAVADTPRGFPVAGQAAVSWLPDHQETASLDVLRMKLDVPSALTHALAHHALHDAFEAGASTVVASVTDPAIGALAVCGSCVAFTRREYRRSR